MKYAELDKRAQDRAREAWLNVHDLDYGWWESVYEDVATIGELIGLEIGRRSHKNADYFIHFSGFYSQGDGACWSGRVKTVQFADAVKKIKEHCGADEQILAIASYAEAIYVSLVTTDVIRRLSSEMEDECDEFNSYTTKDMVLAVQGSERGFNTYLHSDCGIPMAINNDINALVESFAGWIYTQLRNEYDYLTSDESIIQSIESADADFDEEGNCL